MVLCQPEPVVLVYQSKAAQGDIYTLVRENKQNKSEKKKKKKTAKLDRPPQVQLPASTGRRYHSNQVLLTDYISSHSSLHLHFILLFF